MSFKQRFMGTPNDLFGVGKKNGEFGIEIELEGRVDVLGWPPATGWHQHDENSLRHGGREYVSSSPIYLKAVEEKVDALSGRLDEAKVRVNLGSPRTSTHIHYNVSAHPLADILGSTVVFTMIEPLLMRIIGAQRDGNLFCMPSYDCGDLTWFFEGWMHFFHGWRAQPNRGKYSAQNYGRLIDLGTVEYRVFPCSLDGKQIKEWCSWIKTIHDIARKENDKSFRMLVKRVKDNPWWLVNEFGFAPKDVKAAAHPNTVEDCVLYGCREAYELTRVIRHAMKKAEQEDDKPAPEKKLIFGKVAPAEEHWGRFREDMANLIVAQPAPARRRDLPR